MEFTIPVPDWVVDYWWAILAGCVWYVVAGIAIRLSEQFVWDAGDEAEWAVFAWLVSPILVPVVITSLLLVLPMKGMAYLLTTKRPKPPTNFKGTNA